MRYITLQCLKTLISMYTKSKETHQTYSYKSWRLKNEPHIQHPWLSKRWYENGFYSKELIYKEECNKSKEDGEFTKATGMNEYYIHGLQWYEVIVKREQKGAKILPWRRYDIIKKRKQGSYEKEFNGVSLEKPAECSFSIEFLWT